MIRYGSFRYLNFSSIANIYSNREAHTNHKLSWETLKDFCQPISKDSITFGDVVKSGGFGVISYGTIRVESETSQEKVIQVAIKMLNKGTEKDQERIRGEIVAYA